MILTLIVVGVLILSIIFIIIGACTWSDELETTGWLFGIFSIIGFVICMGLIIEIHAKEDLYIAQDNIQYESLCKRLEIVDSEYEDISKSDVIKDIAEWNEGVINQRYWTYNPWTNWFHSEKITENLKTIDY